MGGGLTEVERWFDGEAVLYRSRSNVDGGGRGSLTAFALDQIGLVPRRAFVVTGVPAGAPRGGHAHTNGEQLLVCTAGSVAIELRCDGGTAEAVLDAPALALLVRAGVWARQVYAGPDTVLSVLASTPYDPESYVAEPR